LSAITVVRYSVRCKLEPAVSAGALVPWPGSSTHTGLNPGIMGHVDGERAVPQSTTASQPALQWVRMFTDAAGGIGEAPDDLDPMKANGTALFDVGVADQGSFSEGPHWRAPAERLPHSTPRILVQRPGPSYWAVGRVERRFRFCPRRDGRPDASDRSASAHAVRRQSPLISGPPRTTFESPPDRLRGVISGIESIVP